MEFSGTPFFMPLCEGLFSCSCRRIRISRLFLFHLEPIFLQTSGRKSRNVSIIFMFSFGETYVSAVRTVRFALRSRRFFVAET
ncbi:hypothetical protein BACPLE_00300 [Phocaeicola plebeius DSM 17135]|uniref:Uncharacterized protein n=1 Tax=Phocaeicola plebeius (strain DSM 17135 / JCM 12973 / CCUG 54634 / M2) TaxID=484018 RepID=B5CUD0_PHOPM|nr:hypothetical protein BACPLE_00300 [Phocaeicola plebeius DSM 17135]